MSDSNNEKIDDLQNSDGDNHAGTKTPLSLESSDSHTNPTGINEKQFLRKLDLKLLPPLTLLYLLSFLDRSNVGNAKLEGLTTDLHFTNNQYLFTLTIYFIAYVLFEIPANIILKRTTPRFWLPTCMVAWGIVSTLMGVTQSFGGFVAVRFFLGLTESGLFPGVVFYLSMWYKRNEQHYRVALFFSAASLAGAFGGILAYGIGFMKGVAGLNGWRWIFILEGILTVVVALGSYFTIQNYPATATFLSTEERAFIHARLKSDSDATNNEGFSWSNVRACLGDYKCWLYGLAFHTMSLPLYTLSLFLPSIITGLGFKAAEAQLLTIPPYAFATILTITTAILSEKYKFRAPFIMASSSLAIIGYIILLTAKHPGVSYVGIHFAAAGIYPATAIVLAWPANNVSGQTKRATATALMISVGNLGAIVGTQLYRPATAPRYFLGHGFACGYLVMNLVVVGTLWACLRRENEGKRREIEAGGGLEGEFTGDADPRWVFQT